MFFSDQFVFAESEACSCTDLWWNYPASNCCRDKSFMESKKKKVGCEKIKVNCKKVRYYDLSLCCPKPKVIEINEMTHTTKNTPGHHNNLGALGVRSLKKANGGQGTGIAHGENEKLRSIHTKKLSPT